jgi:hypothetical protein
MSSGIFLKIAPKQNVEKALSKADKEYRQAEHDLKEASMVYRSHDVMIPSEKESEIKLIIDKYEHAKKSLSEIRNKNEKRGRKDWMYRPVFRGFLLYLYCECVLVQWKKDTPRYERKESKECILKTLSNPLVIQEVPFLLHWKNFKKHFDVIGLLKQIAVELYNQLHITAENDRYLLRRATERYFIQLENHLNFILDAPGSSFFIREHGNRKVS